MILALMAAEPAPAANDSAWQTKLEVGVASGNQHCVVYQPGFPVSIVLISRDGSEFQSLFAQAGRYSARRAYLRADDRRWILEKGMLTGPHRDWRVLGEVFGATTLYAEVHPLRGDAVEGEADTEGLAESYRECRRLMGWAGGG